MGRFKNIINYKNNKKYSYCKGCHIILKTPQEVLKHTLDEIHILNNETGISSDSEEEKPKPKSKSKQKPRPILILLS